MKFNNYSPRLASAGIGLRQIHFDDFLKAKQPVPWLEIHAENFLNFHTPAFKILERIREDYPLSIHAVNLSLGSSDGIDEDHVKQVKALIDRLEPFFVSDHLSWGRIDGYYMNDLLPIPYTVEALALLTSNLSRVQEILGRVILIENPSSYLQYEVSEIDESEFLATLVQRTGSGIVLDVNNLFVSCSNHNWNMDSYLKTIPAAKVKEIHLGGHSLSGTLRIDDHSTSVCPDVWDLYKRVIGLYGPLPTLIEWDVNIPDLNDLLNESKQAQQILNSIRIPSNVPRKERHVRFG